MTLNFILGENGVITNAREATFKTEVSQVINFWEDTLFDRTLSGVDTSLIEIISNEDKNSSLSAIRSDLLAKLEVHNGTLVYLKNKCSEEEIKWFEDLGIYAGYSIDVKVSTILHSTSTQITVQQGYDLVFILDISGSMDTATGSGTRFTDMVSVVNNAIDEVMKNELNRIAVVVFSSPEYTKTLIPLDRYSTTDNSNTYLYLSGNYIYIGEKVINSNNKNRQTFNPSYSVSTTGGTYTQLGIKLGATILTDIASGAIPSLEKYKNNTPSVILLTDGMPLIYSATYSNPNSSSYTNNYSYLRWILYNQNS